MMRIQITERFWSKVKKTESCWLWSGGCFDHGYGRFKVEGKEWYAHRYMLQEICGVQLPAGHHVHHTCRVPGCVNPDHLEVVTPREHKHHHPSFKTRLTHCIRGHELNEENTLIRRNGTRNCRACARIRNREYRREGAPAAELAA
jgi:hypothetical protein